MKPVILITSDYAKVEKREIHSCDSRYVSAVIEAGAIPLICPGMKSEDAFEDILKMVDGVLFTGGDDYPPELYDQKPHPLTIVMHSLRAESDLILCRAALKKRLPVLGICGGCQLINIVRGGRLVQHVNDINHNHSNVTHNVIISDSGILGNIYGEGTEIAVRSYHHQALDPDCIGKGLRVTAKSVADGIVEAVEMDKPGRFVIGVQWHPERYESFKDRNKFLAPFIQAASDYKNALKD